MRGSSEQEVAERILGHAELSGLQVKPYKTVAIWFFFVMGNICFVVSMVITMVSC